MKTLISISSALLGDRSSRYNLLSLAKLILVLATLMLVYSVLFHLIMEWEGQEHSWLTGFYWTLTVMSTLGFGDITFQSDLGRLFSIVVLLTGVMFLLVLLPFTFIEFFYAPWMKAQEAAKAPQKVPPGTEKHVILTHYGPVGKMLSGMLLEYGYPYFVLVPTVQEALALRDQGVPVVVGDRSDPETYRRIAIDKAAMVVTTLDDVINTNVTFTVRELEEHIPIVASATSDSIRDALELAGVTQILRLEEMMGRALARRVIGNNASAHVIGELDGLQIAEASPANSDLVGKTIASSGLRALTGVTVVGLWIRGQFEPVEPQTEIGRHTVLVMAGAKHQLDRYNKLYGQKSAGQSRAAPPGEQGMNARVVIAGGGRVGRATARSLTEAGVEWIIIEKLPERVHEVEHAIIGDAAEFEVLVRAGMQEATTIIITTHDDDMNIFLTIFYRRLRQRIQIISRCTDHANAARLHRAGANLVLSYASMGANTIFNVLRGSDTLLLAEGVNIFPARVPRSIAGTSIRQSAVRSRTGCSILAVEIEGNRELNPDPDTVLPEDGKLVLIGALEAERRFLATFEPQVKR